MKLTIKTNIMKRVYYHTHDLRMPSIQLLDGDLEQGAHVLFINPTGAFMFVAGVSRVTKKGFHVSTIFLTPTPVDMFIPFSLYHAYLGDDDAQKAYRDKRFNRRSELQ